MTGVFETAAGAFAVVGVADVLIRTGREIITFLHDVKDAPEDVSRLCQTIEDTVGLADGLKRCIDDLKTRGTSFATTDNFTALESATKSSNRELQTLKVATAKFKATKKTWSNVKYVLSKDKVAKTTCKLEHLKALLGGCLTQAYGELSADDHANIETALRTGFDKVVTHISTSSQDVQTRLDGLQRSVVSAGDVRHQELTMQTRRHIEGVKSTLDGNQNTLLARHDNQQISLSAIQRAQSTLLNRQTRVASHTSKQTASILRTVERGNRRAARDSNAQLGKLEDVVTEVKHVKQLLSRNNGGAARTPRSNRSISFLGENREDILMYLLPLQKELMTALDTLTDQHGQEVSMSDACWLREEIQALVSSAYQEGAARYTGSTATSMDQWSYPEDTVGYLRDSDPKQASLRSSPSSCPEDNEEGDNQVTRLLPKARQISKRKWTIHMPSSETRIDLPRSSSKKKPARYTEEVGLRSRLTQGQARIEICARFVRDMINNSCISRYIQLNVFVEANYDNWEIYNNLFEEGTIEEVDLVLRQGTISPFHLDSEGENLCLYYATMHERLDILDYLENQGVGQSALNHDTSILMNSWRFTLSTDRSPMNPTIIPKLATRAADPAAFVSTIAVYAVVNLSWVPDNEDLKELLNACLNVVQQCGYGAPTWESHRRTDDVSESHVDLIRFLFTTGASLEIRFIGENYLHEHLENARLYGLTDEKSIVNILAVLIEQGVDTGSRDYDGITPSMLARAKKVWPQWCKALENNGKRIEDVLKLEGNAWLLQEDWRDVWKKRGHPREWILEDIDEDSDEDGGCITDENADEDSQEESDLSSNVACSGDSEHDSDEISGDDSAQVIYEYCEGNSEAPLDPESSTKRGGKGTVGKNGGAMVD